MVVVVKMERDMRCDAMHVFLMAMMFQGHASWSRLEREASVALIMVLGMGRDMIARVMLFIRLGDLALGSCCL